MIKRFAGFMALLLAIGACTGRRAAMITHTSPDGLITTVTAIRPGVLRVDCTPAGTDVTPEQSVLHLEPELGCGTVEDGVLSTDGVKAYFDPSGELIIDNGNISISDAIKRVRGAEGSEIALATNSKGSYYGAGERGHKLNLRGDTLVMYNRQNYGYTEGDSRINQMNITMPLLLSSDGFGLVFDDFAAAKMIPGDTVKYITESDKPVSYYFVNGRNGMDQMTERMTELTGRQPIAPLWSLGYITSKYGYRTQAETEGTIDTLIQGGYPVDGIVLDLYWYGVEQDMGRLAWDSIQWPEPEQMLKRLQDKGVNLVAISQPYVLRNGRGVDNYNELVQKGLLLKDSVSSGPQEVTIWVGEGGMFDVSNPDTRKWLADRYQSLTDGGVAGWWGDLGEPEVHPQNAVHANGLTARQYHNHYGNDWAAIISELFADKYPDRRLMTLMRGGTIGLQRQSVFPWSTDVSRSWGGLQPQVKIMLHSGLSGMGYMSSDLGGFAIDPENPYQPELYLRWVQMGLFSPVFRTHSQQFAEPYKYPMYEDILKQIVKDRYRWLPYNYTLAYENAAFGQPLVRPLDFDKSAGGAYDNIVDEYMWGSEVLVAPVLTEGTVSRNVVLPAGSKWVDFYDASKVYEGGTVLKNYPAPLSRIPLFVKGGAIIPMADYAMKNTGDFRADEYTVNYYPTGGKSSYRLYDDNHLSPASIADGEYRIIAFYADDQADAYKLDISSKGEYKGAPEAVKMNYAVHGIRKAPKSVTVNGAHVKSAFDAATGTLKFTFTYTPGKITKIEIRK